MAEQSAMLRRDSEDASKGWFNQQQLHLVRMNLGGGEDCV